MKALKKLNAVLGYICGILVVITALILLYDVFCRYVLGEPTLWAQQIAAYMVLVATFFGTSYALQSGGHVHVEIIVDELGFYRISGKFTQVQNVFDVDGIACTAVDALLISVQYLHNSGAHGSVAHDCCLYHALSTPLPVFLNSECLPDSRSALSWRIRPW